MEQLTNTQEAIFDFIVKFIDDNGLPPSYQDIADEFGYRSVNGVRQHLQLIAKKGYIRMVAGRARGIEVLHQTAQAPAMEEHGEMVPLVGSIPAGTPVLSEENHDTTLVLDKSLFHGSELYTLRVSGDSMLGDNITDGDIAVISQEKNPRPNDIVVVVIDGEATLKRVHIEDNTYVITPSNPAYEVRHYDVNSTDVRIAGKLIGILRQM